MTPTAGVIEGFFGREWPWGERAAYAAFLADHGFQFYIYAPKGDRYLRQLWHQDWPEDTWRELSQLRQAYRDRGVAFGLGLSPFDVQQDYSPEARRQLQRKTERLNELEPDLLCILFDDMKGDVDGLAAIQVDMAHTIASASRAQRHLVCPSYYSDDPVLEKVFGAAPPGYLEDLGRDLDPHLELFWTGPRVCSTEYPPEHLEQVAQRLGRRPFLWDNYPVNDGARMSKHLHLRPFRPHQRPELIAGVAINPMNQPWLSRLPLLTWAASWRPDYAPETAFAQALTALEIPPALAQQLQRDLQGFHDGGLETLDLEALKELYRQLPDHPCRREVIDWLDGEYRFDPACLTD